MSESDEKDELVGAARSIDALFSRDEPEPALRVPVEPEAEPPPVIIDDAAPAEPTQPAETSDDLTWEKAQEQEEAPLPIEALEADADALAAALDRFLATPPIERDGQAREIRELAIALRDTNALDPLANAVERLVLEASDDEASLALADLMVTAGVASRFAAWLGLERDEDRRARLMQVCRSIGLEMAIAISDALSDTTDRFARRTLMEAMINMGSTGMVVIEQMIEDRRWFVVRNGLAILGEVGGDQAVELITSSLAHTDARVRKEALLALAKVGGEDAGMLVYGMLEDPDPEARLAAAMAVGALKVERALKPLIQLLEDEDDADVTVGILHALGQLGDPGAVNTIEKHAVGSFFSRPPAGVRIAAYRALFNIGTPHARQLVDQACEDKDDEVKGAVREILGRR